MLNEKDRSNPSTLVTESTGRESIPADAGLTISTHMVINIIPQSHIDLIWYWPPSESIRMILNTFRGHVEKLESDSECTYVQSQAFAYEIVRNEAPELFDRVRKLVASGQWEPVGGEWVEADPSIPGPEARIRQHLYGQLFFEKYFGCKATVGWCPDGFTVLPGNWPQILLLSGMKSFVHKRPREKNKKMPVTPYIWRGLDGSEVLALRMNNKGIGLPVLSEGYRTPQGKGDLSVIAQANLQNGFDQLFGPMGVGDIGGVNSYKLPVVSGLFKFQYSTAGIYFDRVNKKLDRQKMPVIFGSISPESMGAMTTWATIKKLNRKAEAALQTAEYLVSLAVAMGISSEAVDISQAWKRVLLCQFHDSVAGCGTEDILPVIEHYYRQSIIEAETIALRFMRRIAESINLDIDAGLPVTVFNPLGMVRSDMTLARITLPKDYLDLVPFGSSDTLTHKVDCRSFIPTDELEAIDDAGHTVPVMITHYAQIQKKFVIDVRFMADNVQAFGYSTFYLHRRNKRDTTVTLEDNVIRTDKWAVCFDMERGGISAITSINPKEGNGQIIEGFAENPLGQLAIHHTGNYEPDYGMELRAWNTGFTGRVDVLRPVSNETRQYSGHRVRVIFYYHFGDSTFSQEFMLEPGIESIDVLLKGDWQELEKYLKIHFTLNRESEQSAFADLPYGFTEHLPEGQEYLMQYLTGIRHGRKGLGVLNDSRYGCMWKNGTLSLSVIRCATFPAHRSDSGPFEMQYRIVPLDATKPDWQSRIIRAGFEYNFPLQAYSQEFTTGKHPTRRTILSGSESEILVTCLKPSEKGNGLVMRLFNPTNRAITKQFFRPAGFTMVTPTDLLEEPIHGADVLVDRMELQFRPYEIKTLILSYTMPD